MNQGYSDLQPVAELAARNQQLMTLSQELYNKMGRGRHPMTLY